VAARSEVIGETQRQTFGDEGGGNGRVFGGEMVESGATLIIGAPIETQVVSPS
jgi:hypothetical protein